MLCGGQSYSINLFLRINCLLIKELLKVFCFCSWFYRFLSLNFRVYNVLFFIRDALLWKKTFSFLDEIHLLCCFLCELGYLRLPCGGCCCVEHVTHLIEPLSPLIVTDFQTQPTQHFFLLGHTFWNLKMVAYFYWYTSDLLSFKSWWLSDWPLWHLWVSLPITNPSPDDMGHAPSWLNAM